LNGAVDTALQVDKDGSTMTVSMTKDAELTAKMLFVTRQVEVETSEGEATTSLVLEPTTPLSFGDDFAKPSEKEMLLYDVLAEADVLDTQEATGILETLFNRLSLDNKDLAFHHLKLSEEHYLAGRWDDSISNARKFLESTLQEVAASHSLKVKGGKLSDSTYSRPVAVRDYLETETLLESKEKEAIAKIYGLLSHTGGHPYMAQNDQARLLRHLALTLSQFVLLRYEGSLTKAVVKS
jgi:hypothetical protein